jgi:RNA polymerase sigma-70 factor (ECF subfamily)
MNVFNGSTTNGTFLQFTSDYLKSLIDKAKIGDETAYTEIYNAFFEKIYRFIYFRVSHRESAEDLTEEVFIKVFENIGKLENSDVFEGWVYQIARNKIIDHYRSKRITVNLDEIENTAQYEDTIIDTLSSEGDQKLLLEAIKQLPEDYQAILKLRFFENHSPTVIAEMLGKNEGSIRVLQHRATAKLKTIFDSLQNRE